MQKSSYTMCVVCSLGSNHELRVSFERRTKLRIASCFKNAFGSANWPRTDRKNFLLLSYGYDLTDIKERLYLKSYIGIMHGNNFLRLSFNDESSLSVHHNRPPLLNMHMLLFFVPVHWKWIGLGLIRNNQISAQQYSFQARTLLQKCLLRC